MDIIAYIILIAAGVAILGIFAYYDHKHVPTSTEPSIFTQIYSAVKDMKELHEDLKPIKKEARNDENL